MKYCSDCGSQNIKQQIPHGDNRNRFVCNACQQIYYDNPRVICGSLVHYQDQVLLCRRAIEPRLGYWTLPAGFMENGETTFEAAKRETWEEALANTLADQLYCIFNLPHINQVYFFYRGELENGKHDPGTESLETQLFYENDIPWDNLAFPTITRALKLYFKDISTGTGQFPIRNEDIIIK